MEYFIFYCLAALICALVSCPSLQSPALRRWPGQGNSGFCCHFNTQNIKYTRAASSRAEPSQTKIHLNFLHFIFCTFSARRIKRNLLPAPLSYWPPPLSLFALFAREICACLPFGMSARMLHGFRRDLFCCATTTTAAPAPALTRALGHCPLVSWRSVNYESNN